MAAASMQLLRFHARTLAIKDNDVMKIYRATVWYHSAMAQAVGEPMSKGHVYKRAADDEFMFKAQIKDELMRSVDDDVHFGPISVVDMMVGNEPLTDKAIRNRCDGKHLRGCSRDGRPNCTANECLYGLEKCPAGNHYKPIGGRCGFQHERRSGSDRRGQSRDGFGYDRRGQQRRQS